ncbi:MAG: S8 family serine peptidase, partial [Pseudomonadota bacterium]
LEEARTAVTALNPAAVADFNHFYRTGQGESAAGSNGEDNQIEPAVLIPECEGPGCAAPRLIAWPGNAELRPLCSADIRIGLIDTGINIEHSTFERKNLEVLNLSETDQDPSGKKHGTAVAALFLGDRESRSPGLLPNAMLVAVDAFHTGSRNDERSDVFSLVKALDLIAARNVSVINLSLSGPENTLLADMVERLATQNIILIAAAGNGGPRSKPVYPAAYPNVIAVTAIDRNKRIYRRAARGGHIDFAAPGVQVWTAASIRGARTKTGTSFATPFVTASVALVQKGLNLETHDEVVGALASRALDLGDPGKDPVFGYGLVQAREICGNG